MSGSTLHPQLHVALVDVFAPQGTTGLRVGVCAPPSGVSLDRCDPNWCAQVRQRLGVAVLLLRDGIGHCCALRGPRQQGPVRAFDPSGELPAAAASMIDGLVLAHHHGGEYAGAHDGASAGSQATSSNAWVRVHGVSTCRARPSLLTPVGIALGLRRSELDLTLPSIVALRETSTLVLPVQSRSLIQSMAFDPSSFEKACSITALGGCLVYASTSTPNHFVARLLMPGIASWCSIASPIAACALTKVLITHRVIDRGSALVMEQLTTAGDASVVEITADPQPRSRTFRVGGHSRFAGLASLELAAPRDLPHP